VITEFQPILIVVSAIGAAHSVSFQPIIHEKDLATQPFRPASGLAKINGDQKQTPP
jgi:hypothetical protein